jgi:signal transduction histidine kinase
LAQELAFIATHAQRLDLRTVGRREEQATLAAQLGTAAQRALDESRFAIAALTEPFDESLDASVTRAAEEVAVRYGARVRFDVEGSIHVSAPVRAALARIVREAVTNAVRHGEADEVRVELKRSGDGLRLAVSDSGRGFDPAAVGQAGFGLRSMRERARALDASLELSAAPGAGCRVEVQLR